MLLIYMEKSRVFGLGLSDPHSLSYPLQYFVVPSTFLQGDGGACLFT